MQDAQHDPGPLKRAVLPCGLSARPLPPAGRDVPLRVALPKSRAPETLPALPGLSTRRRSVSTIRVAPISQREFSEMGLAVA
jgi:hypothetical protein